MAGLWATAVFGQAWVPEAPPAGAASVLATLRGLRDKVFVVTADEEVRWLQRHLFFLDGLYREPGEPVGKPVSVALLKGEWEVARQALATAPAGPMTEWQAGLLAFVEQRYDEAATRFGGLAGQPGELGNLARLWAGRAQVRAWQHPETALRDVVTARLQRAAGGAALTADEIVDLLHGLYLLREDGEVVRQADRYLARLEKDPRFYFPLALTLIRLGRLEQARGALALAINLGAKHPRVSQTYVSVSQNLNRPEEAYREQVAADVLWGDQPRPRLEGGLAAGTPSGGGSLTDRPDGRADEWFAVRPADIVRRAGVDRPTARLAAARSWLAGVTGAGVGLAREALGDLAWLTGAEAARPPAAGGAPTGAAPTAAAPSGAPASAPANTPPGAAGTSAGSGAPSAGPPGATVSAPAVPAGGPAAAADFYRQALEADPLLMAARWKLVMARLEQGKHGAAFDEFLALSAWTTLPQGYHAVARWRTAAPEVFQALADLFARSLYAALETAAADPEDAAPWRTAAAVAFSLFQFELAARYAREAQQRAGASPAVEWLLHLARFREAEYAQRPLDDAKARLMVTALTPLAESFPDPLPDVLCARLHDALKQPELARLHWQRALARKAEDPTVLFVNARFALDKGDTAKARELFERLFRREYTTGTAALARHLWQRLSRRAAAGDQEGTR
jgi:tetratricopeptide (TPR) repeat protein